MPFIQLQFRRDTSQNWANTNPVLASGEMGIELDTHMFKIGDGIAPWVNLAYGGIQGPRGPQGPAGSGSGSGGSGGNGAQGSTGPQGPAGPSGGPTGPQGPQGSQGGIGPMGPSGSNGTAGTNGTNGSNGAPGANGPAGAQGPQGPAGSNGSNGSAGAQGPTGPSGGPQGPQGPAGSSGAAGSQGPAGSNGSPGQGVPAGGTSGQVLAKINSTNYNTQWITPSASGGSNYYVELTYPTSNGTLFNGGTLPTAVTSNLPASYTATIVSGQLRITNSQVTTSNAWQITLGPIFVQYAAGSDSLATWLTSPLWQYWSPSAGIFENRNGVLQVPDSSFGNISGNGAFTGAGNGSSLVMVRVVIAPFFFN